MIAYFNGKFLNKGDIRISPDDRGFLFADSLCPCRGSIVKKTD